MLKQSLKAMADFIASTHSPKSFQQVKETLEMREREIIRNSFKEGKGGIVHNVYTVKITYVHVHACVHNLCLERIPNTLYIIFPPFIIH